jgi:hypothetical protein
MVIPNRFCRLSLFLLFWVSTSPLFADEGLWLFNRPPLKELRDKYQFTPTSEWLEHLQRSSVRFNNGGSGSFISADGLVITNHHVGKDAIQQFGDGQHDYVRDGFYAKTLADEKRCFDMELNVLMSIEDVTGRVNAAIKKGMSAAQAFQARRNTIAEIEKESFQKTGLRSNVITLYNGGSYQLYRYKQYTDIRLVFAPEGQVAFFGGDPDNFEYPRYNFDICLFRVYENGKPLHTGDYLKLNPNGPSDRELTFISGNPGSTHRQWTVSDFTYYRDTLLPEHLAWIYLNEVTLSSWSARSLENARRAKDLLDEVQNGRKLYDGELAGLLDPEFFQKLVDKEKAERARFNVDPRFKAVLGAYDRIAKVQTVMGKNRKLFNTLEGGGHGPEGFSSDLFDFARLLVRATEERKKPNGERLPEFRDSARSSLELLLFSRAPIYDDLEKVRLSMSLTRLANQLGADDPLVKRVLAGKSPHDRAVELVKGCQLKDVNIRKKWYEGGELVGFSDPMIQLAREIDPAARMVRKIYEEQSEIKAEAYTEIAKARFETGGESYPDATFTPRFGFGVVMGYKEDGKKVAPFTTFDGLYRQVVEHEGKAPFDLPSRWVRQKDKLNLATPFNFVNTADSIGGNSGSPVVNKAGEFVGILFDGNIQSLVGNSVYTEKQARSVVVDSAAIVEALDKIYDAQDLVTELRQRPVARTQGLKGSRAQ